MGVKRVLEKWGELRGWLFISSAGGMGREEKRREEKGRRREEKSREREKRRRGGERGRES